MNINPIEAKKLLEEHAAHEVSVNRMQFISSDQDAVSDWIDSARYHSLQKAITSIISSDDSHSYSVAVHVANGTITLTLPQISALKYYLLAQK